MIKGLYVHIPFCRHICYYCDFSRCIYDKSLSDRYLQHLRREIEMIDQNSFETIYIGGGTPTSLDKEQLIYLLESLARFKNVKEYTVEINPESFDLEKAQLLKKYGVNRVSIGVQTFNENLLTRIGRKHNNIDVLNTLEYLTIVGIKNRSIDLMFGFKEQTLKDVLNDLHKSVMLDIQHISIYDLEIYPRSKFGLQKYQKADEELTFMMYQTIIEFLNQHSYGQYEISNFALPTFQSQHNKIYWYYQDYAGVGLSACGKIGKLRYENTENFVKYLSDNYRSKEINLSNDDIRFEALMMNLRLNEGIDIRQFDRRFQCNILEDYHQAVEKNIQSGLLEIKDSHLKTTAKGIFVLNDILIDFMN
ncbi:MAG: radical SAM family heme chaperone HemW [Erysipelotrichia bacterium]|nr:radical SAM family heme chaperone HemW [Erysipelotrichia bacterium]